jgi:coenzyme PQQ precursor peptide PqqA
VARLRRERAVTIINGSEQNRVRSPAMRWSKPVVEEICIGLEINGYYPAEF